MYPNCTATTSHASGIQSGERQIIGPPNNRIIKRARVIDRVSSKLRESDYNSEEKKSRKQCVTPNDYKANEQTIIDTFRAVPVRQSDHGANVSSETAITLMTIVAITTHKRPRSSARSCVFVRDKMPL